MPRVTRPIQCARARHAWRGFVASGATEIQFSRTQRTTTGSAWGGDRDERQPRDIQAERASTCRGIRIAGAARAGSVTGHKHSRWI